MKMFDYILGYKKRSHYHEHFALTLSK